MYIELWSAAPFFAGRDQFEFDDTFGAERHGDRAIESLRRRWRENAGALAQCGQNLGTPHDLSDVRRSNFLFAFTHKNEIHRQLAARATDRMDGREKGGLRSL